MNRRGPFLAEIELESRIINQNKDTNLQNLLTLLVNYFNIFGDRTLCYGDLKPYLSLINKDKELIQKLCESIKSSIQPSLPTVCILCFYNRIENNMMIERWDI